MVMTRIGLLQAVALTLSAIPTSLRAEFEEGKEEDAPAEAKGCKLMADWRGYVVQGLLAVISLASLIVKRHIEKPRRPFDVWVLDVLKQVFSGGCAHLMGMLNAIVLDKIEKGEALMGRSGDECSWYLIAFSLDTTFGVVFAYCGIKIVERLALRYGWLPLQETGWYGDPPDWMVWVKQMVVWCIIAILAHLFVLCLMVATKDLLSVISNAVATPFEGEPTLFLVLVMIVCPLGMNSAQLWIQDTFLKFKDGWAAMRLDTGCESLVVPGDDRGSTYSRVTTS